MSEAKEPIRTQLTCVQQLGRLWGTPGGDVPVLCFCCGKIVSVYGHGKSHDVLESKELLELLEKDRDGWWRSSMQLCRGARRECDDAKQSCYIHGDCYLWLYKRLKAHKYVDYLAVCCL